jgi:hypothetical protein
MLAREEQSGVLQGYTGTAGPASEAAFVEPETSPEVRSRCMRSATAVVSCPLADLQRAQIEYSAPGCRGALDLGIRNSEHLDTLAGAATNGLCSSRFRALLELTSVAWREQD